LPHRRRHIRQAFKAPEFVCRHYGWLSKFAHGGLENGLLMGGGPGWMPLQTGLPNARSARIALVTAAQVAAMACAEFVAPFGRLEVPWYAAWTKGQETFHEGLYARVVSLSEDLGAPGLPPS
jgi:hypothetical protein